MMRLHRTFGALAALAALAFLPNGAGAADPPYEILGIMAVTGPFAAVGSVEAQTLGVVEGVVNRSGGIKGRPIKFVIRDDQSSPQLAVQFMNGAIAGGAPAVIGPSFAATCGAAGPLVAKSGPVSYCLSPGIHPEQGSYVFSTTVATSDQAPILIRYFRERGWMRIASITSIDATGQDVEHQLDSILAAPENKGMELVTREHFSPTDLSVGAQMQHVRASNAQALFTWSTGTAFGTLLHGIHDAGIELPVGSSSGNMTFSQLTQYKSFLPAQLYFPAGRGFSLEAGRGPVHDAQVVYFNALKAAGLKPEIGPSAVWDPAMLVVDALRHIGTNATATQIRDYIEGLRGWNGIGGTYDFSDREHPNRGLGQNEGVVYRWNGSAEQFDIVSKPAGYLR
jgi:branched-chain amino acid transport system substrate-binding protein